MLYSICVPTYKRPEQIKRMLGMFEHILEDSPNSKIIEICISDNNPNDETGKIVKEFRKRGLLNIIYYRQGQNVGYDKNAFKALSLATGDYVHLVSDEVIYSKGCLATILEKLADKKDGLMVHRKAMTGASAKSLLAKIISLRGITSLFGTYMAMFAMKREFMDSFREKYEASLDEIAGRGFIHLPIFLHFLGSAGELGFVQADIDSGKQAIFYPSDKANVFIKQYFMIFRESAGLGIISKEQFAIFKRNFELTWPYQLLKIRIYMKPGIYEAEIEGVSKVFREVEGEYSGLGNAWLKLCESLIFTKFIPYHLIYLAWHQFKIKVRRDPKTVNYFEQYETMKKYEKPVL